MQKKKNFRHLYTDYLKDANTRCLMLHTSGQLKLTSDIALEELKPELARAILKRAKEFGVDVESPTVLQYAAE